LGKGRRSDKGAAVVEFAVLAPLLLLLLLGIIEFGWLFGQLNDVRHGAREGARFAAVNQGDETAIRDHVCAAMDGLSAGLTSIDVILVNDGGTKGSNGTIRVVAAPSSLSNVPIITPFLPATLESEIDFRLEQDSTQWTSNGPAGLSC
jgi:Flp pilus assembly protein TadG